MPIVRSAQDQDSNGVNPPCELKIMLHQPSTVQARQQRTFYPDVEWEKWKPLITDLYIERDMKLIEIMQYMARFYDFHAGISSYKLRLRTWGLKKNYSTAQKDAIAAELETQGAEQFAEDQILINNKPVRMDKIERHKRHKRSRQRQFIETLTPFILDDKGEAWLRHIYTAFKGTLTTQHTQSLAYWASTKSQTIWLYGLQLYSGVYAGIFSLEQFEFDKGRHALDEALELAKEIITSRTLTFVAIIISLIADPIFWCHPDLRRILFQFFASMCARLLDKQHSLAQIARMAAEYDQIKHAIAGADRLNLQMWREIIHTDTSTASQVHDIMLSGWLGVAPDMKRVARECWSQTSMINQARNLQNSSDRQQLRERPLSMWYLEDNKIHEDLRDCVLGIAASADHESSATSTSALALASDSIAKGSSDSIIGVNSVDINTVGDNRDSSPIFDWL